MNKVKNKQDVIVETWLSLNKKVVGAKEIEAIEEALRKSFGEGAVDMPMRIARVLADAGAHLKYPEIMSLDFQRRSQSKYDSMFRNILRFQNFEQALKSIRNLENLRRKFLAEGDKKGLNLVRQTAMKGKERASMIARNQKISPQKRAEKSEIAEWFRIYLESPSVFDKWIEVRIASEDFKEKFSR